MRQTAILLALALTAGTPALEAKHPTHAQQAQTENVQPATATDDGGIEAVSDTTAAAPSANTQLIAQQSQDAFAGTEDTDIVRIIRTGFWGEVIVIIGILILGIFLLSPVLIIFLVLRYYLKKKEQQARIIEAALQSGHYSVPEKTEIVRHFGVAAPSRDQQWKSGISTAALGAGLTILFLCMEVGVLAGVGGFVLCYGLGKMAIAYTTREQNTPTPPAASDPAPTPANADGDAPAPEL